jgi:hypothetical protein
MDLDDKVTAVRDALEAKFGDRTTWEIAEGIINVYSQPIPADGPDAMQDQYLATVTVTVTP